MQRIIFAAAIAVLAAAGAHARADFGGVSGPAPGLPAPEAVFSGGGDQVDVGQRFGLMPWLRRGVWWKKDFGGCSGCGVAAVPARGPVAPPAGYGQQMPPAGAPGTLVFPNHQFTRSPRDFFMWEK